MDPSSEKLTSIIDRILSEQPETPRKVHYFSLFSGVSRMKSTIIVFIVGLFMFSCLLLCSLDMELSDRWIIYLINIIPFIMILFPFIGTYRIYNALKNGTIVTTTVKTIQYSGAGANNTLDAMENGIAIGEWIFQDGTMGKFDIDTPWAKDIKVGSHIRVLKSGRNHFPLNVEK